MRVIRESQERLEVEAHRHKIERLRFLGQEEEANALEKEAQARRHGTLRKRRDVDAELAHRQRGAERELKKMAVQIELLIQEGRSEEAQKLRREVGDLKAALTAAMKRAKEVKEVRQTKQPPQ